VPITQDAWNFIQGVSAQTGIDPRVMAAWIEAEDVKYATTGSNPSGTQHYDYLNLRPYPGDPYQSVSPGGFEQFATVQDAITATVRRLNQPFASPIIQAAKAHDTPQQEIAAIASTGWDVAHYGGGSGIANVFKGLFSPAALNSAYLPPTSDPGILADAGAGGHTAVGGDFSTVGGAISGAGSAVGSAVGGAVQSVTGWAETLVVRGGKVVLGAGLILVGLYLIARSFNAVPSPGQITSVIGGGAGGGGGPSHPPPASRENTSGEPLSQSSRAVRRRAGFEPADKRKPPRPARGAPGSTKLAAGDSIPF
jgi:hypothetical protein